MHGPLNVKFMKLPLLKVCVLPLQRLWQEEMPKHVVVNKNSVKKILEIVLLRTKYNLV